MALSYSAYGLRLRANLPLSGLIAAPATPKVDVQVWLGLTPPYLNEVPETSLLWYVRECLDEQGVPTLTVWKMAGGRYFRFLYSDRTEFVIDRSGTQVWASWPSNLTLDDTATYLLGPIMGFVLLLRGVVSLHASAIAVDGRAVAIVGPAGAGKSTTAAAFARRGYSVLSDDVVALIDQGDNFMVQPAYPRLRLWPKSVNALYGAADALPLLTPTWDKRYLDLSERGYQFQQQPLPLAAIYILGERHDDPTAPFAEPMPSHVGLMALVANTYANYLKDRAMRAHEFELLGRLVDHVPVRRLTPHTEPSQLSKLCDLILNDFQCLTSTSMS